MTDLPPEHDLPPKGGSHETEEEIAVAIARAVRDAGGRALIVGGWVRDRLMARDSKDIDLEVYGLEAPGLRSSPGLRAGTGSAGASRNTARALS